MTTQPTPTPFPASRRPRTTRSLYLVALFALAGAACSDESSPTAPEAAEPAPSQAAAALKPQRTPYISDLQLHSIYIDMGPDGTYDNGVDLVLTNPGPRAEGLYLEATIQDDHNTANGGSIWISCQAPEGTLLKGTCRQAFYVTPPPYWLQLGPARLTIRLMQRGPDGRITALDRRTVDVVLVHS